jgi:hypothetical protein
VASAATTASATTAGQGNVRRKHANRGSCDYGYDRFAQHNRAPWIDRSQRLDSCSNS